MHRRRTSEPLPENGWYNCRCPCFPQNHQRYAYILHSDEANRTEIQPCCRSFHQRPFRRSSLQTTADTMPQSNNGIRHRRDPAIDTERDKRIHTLAHIPPEFCRRRSHRYQDVHHRPQSQSSDCHAVAVLRRHENRWETVWWEDSPFPEWLTGCIRSLQSSVASRPFSSAKL